jgi:multimeric flavodoxin WrbA
MKITTIIGSPKGKGKGYEVAKKVESLLSKYEELTFEYIFLKNIDLKPCIGCFMCVKKGIETCPIKDEFTILKKKIDNSDGIILVSPSYVHNVSWIMKNLIDRFAYINHRPQFFDKKLMLISNASSGMESTIKAMRFTFGPGPEIVSEIPYLTPEWEVSDKVADKLKRMLQGETEKFYKSIKSKNKPTPDIQNYVRFKLFKKVSVDVKEYFPADYDYYKLNFPSRNQ